MAAFVDRLVLKHSPDSTAALRTDLALDGDNPILMGELVIGIKTNEEGIYLKNEEGAIKKLPGYSPEPDIHWSNVDLLVNAEPGNVDKSINNINVQQNTAALSAFSKYGDYSYYFDGSKQLYFAFNTTTTRPQNFCTVEAWVYFNNLTQDRGIFVQDEFGSTGSIRCTYLNSTGKITATIYTSTGTYTATSSTNPSINTWHHIAVVRNDTTLTVYLDGVPGTATNVSGTFVTASYWGMGVNSIFNSGIKKYLNGYIDDFRLTNNVARYLTTFTPPQYPAGTILGNQQPIFLNTLSDVVINSPVSGQTLVYNGTNWVNGNPIAGSIDSMPDVNITSVTTGDYLIYDGSYWVNKPVNSDWFIPADGGDFNTGTVASEGNYMLNGGLFT